jgi:hypothetical protein
MIMPRDCLTQQGLQPALMTGYLISRFTDWSIAPKIDLPAASSISMRIMSSNRMNGVLGSPSEMVSRQRFSAMHEYPRDASLFDTVPEPTIVPARALRVLHRCAINCAKLKTMSTPAFGCPTSFPFQVERSGRCTFASFHASPNSSGVTATGEKLVAGLD